MTHRFIIPKPKPTKAAAESAHQKALNALLDVARREGARDAFASAVRIALQDPCAGALKKLLDAVTASLDA